MLTEAVESYLAVRRSLGFKLRDAGLMLESFARYSSGRGKDYICAVTALAWAGLASSVPQRARRLGVVIRFARYIRVEDPRNEIPPQDVFGKDSRTRPIPYILSTDQIVRLVEAASRLGRPIAFRRHTYGTLFGLLACTGLRVSEAIRLRFEDVTPDGLVISSSKFGKSRLVPLHETAKAEVERYLSRRRRVVCADDHVFVSLRKRPLLITDVETAFRNVLHSIGLPPGRKHGGPTPHSLRHTFAVRTLEGSPAGRERITKHMVALSTYLGHARFANTYWYLQATPSLMKDIAEASEAFAHQGLK